MRSIFPCHYAEQSIFVVVFCEAERNFTTSRKSLPQIALGGARIPLKALCLITCFVHLFAACAPALHNPQYGSMTTCQNMQDSVFAFQARGGCITVETSTGI
jgi:hypothetical protein